MAFKLDGSVDVKRISAFLDKVLTQGILADYNVIIDNPADATSFKTTLLALQDILLATVNNQIIINTLFRPSTEPAVDTSIVTLNCEGHAAAMFEPRLSAGTRTINANFTQAFSNVGNTDLVSAVYSLTGTRIITMPSDVLVSNSSSIGVWDGGAKTLTISAMQ